MFKKTGEGTKWVKPTDEEIEKRREQIISAEGEQHAPIVDEDLRAKLDEAVGNIVPGQGWGIIAEANKQVYQTIESITSSPRGVVDIIVPVYNGLHIIKDCLTAVQKRTSWPFRLYIVDDASDEKTAKWLRKYALAYPENTEVITNKKNKGFSASVNRGIKAGKGEYVCLLNSDVVVTPLWLTKMIMAQKANPRNQIVCPATNNTAVVNVPLSEGASYLQMNKVLEKFAVRRYPEIMPTGFCFLFRRELTEKIGVFDEGYPNFGEESDYWMKVIHHVEGDLYPKYRAVMADDAYVFHERGVSFSSLGADAEANLRKQAAGRFEELWPQWHAWRQSYNPTKALGHLRDPIPTALTNEGTHNICWVVHSTQLCGGMMYIADIVNEINEQGGNAMVALIKRNRGSETTYVGNLRTCPVVFEGYEDFAKNFAHKVFRKGIVVAATSEIVGAVESAIKGNPELKGMLHAQSYEPAMINDPNMIKLSEEAFKRFPVLSNSKWITEELKKLKVEPFATISPGVNQNLYYPRGRDKGDDRPTVMVPLINSLPVKGYDRGVALIQDLEKQAKAEGIDIRILVYGVKQMPIVSEAICMGPLPPTRVADLLGKEVDVFIDPSTLHSYGMPCLEALASGVSVVCWNNRGIMEYANSKMASIAPNDAPPEVLAKATLNMLKSKSARKQQAKAAERMLPLHNRVVEVQKVLTAMERQFRLTMPKKRIVVVVPHLRKHGGPTTMLGIANELAAHGHDVSITTVYTDLNVGVTEMTDLPINIDSQNIPACDLIITNSDNPMTQAIASTDVKKIMLKLSHNPRFKQLEEQGLNCKWDAIVTTTKWLKDVCENPTEGWSYPPQKADQIGWWHYSHNIFNHHPKTRRYAKGTKEDPIVIGTLIHAHESKGTQEAIRAMGDLFREFGVAVRFLGIGEVPPKKFHVNLPDFRYRFSPPRQDLAEIMGEIDIWIGASHTEGLGRMALEAMSAGVACVLTDTGADFAIDGKTCLLVPPENFEALRLATRKLIQEPKLAAELRLNAYKVARDKADPSPCMNALEDVIRRIFDGS